MTKQTHRSSLADVPEEVWIRRGQEKALATFQRMARTVPAYRSFLREHGIRSKDVLTFDDFCHLPITSKENYLLKYDLVDLMPGGKLDGTCVITRSSGFSGQPIFWPRSKRQDDGAVRGMNALYSLFDIRQKSTLAIVTYSLGTHAGGQMCTDLSLRVARLPGNKLAVVTPGASIDDALELIRCLSPRFEQTIIWGYPTLLNKIVTTGAESGICWADLNTCIIGAGEGYSENWRRLMVEMLGGDPHPMRVSALFGSADGGVMGFDTPLSILIRQFAHDESRLRNDLFRGKPPLAVVQFNPLGNYFQSVADELIITSWQAIPMIRYTLHDAGDVISFTHVSEQLGTHGLPLDDLAGYGIRPEHVWRWPFLTCFGRSEGTVSIVGANVYPHSLQHIFASYSAVSHFKLAVVENEIGQSRFTVYVEWADGVLQPEERIRIEKKLHEQTLSTLLASNYDYSISYKEDPSAADPMIVLVEKGTGPFATDTGRWKRSYIHK